MVCGTEGQRVRGIDPEIAVQLQARSSNLILTHLDVAPGDSHLAAHGKLPRTVGRHRSCTRGKRGARADEQERDTRQTSHPRGQRPARRACSGPVGAYKGSPSVGASRGAWTPPTGRGPTQVGHERAAGSVDLR